MTVTNEQIDNLVEYCQGSPVSWAKCVIALADQRAELVALLQLAGTLCTAYDHGDERQHDCMCYGCTRRKCLARIGVTP
jgi:hypothetical protein